MQRSRQQGAGAAPKPHERGTGSSERDRGYVVFVLRALPSSFAITHTGKHRECQLLRLPFLAVVRQQTRASDES